LHIHVRAGFLKCLRDNHDIRSKSLKTCACFDRDVQRADDLFNRIDEILILHEIARLAAARLRA